MSPKGTYYCWICGRERPTHCPNPDCRKFEEEMAEAEAIQQHKDLWDAWYAAMKERCNCSDACLRRYQRWFYTVKCLICMTLGRVYHGKDPYPDSITVGYFRQHRDGWGWSADWVEVGWGLFTGWWYRLEHDGECLM